MRDATRGGVATILNEIAAAAGVGVLVSEDADPGPAPRCAAPPNCSASTRCTWPARAAWSRWCRGEDADRAVAALRAHPLGEQAAVIGHIRADQPGIVLLKTAFGGTRIVDLLVGDPLPRIC